ncbi:MerR family transcriptional regulator [Lichenicoccus sp.]|uniref:MerR family transcriptional regulator n=1 Tax=Lichenicoccus sp. TaxID=2781899 RepID=UPI003D09FFFB
MSGVDDPGLGDPHDGPGQAPWSDAGTDAGLFDLEGGAVGGQETGSARLKKSATAFRTISEVADELHVPQHVLRFWETRFPQVKPLKRGGGRRYYRPDDVGLLRRIADLLYIQGYTIKGVQRLLRDGDGTLQGDLPPPEVADQDGDDPPASGQEGAAVLPRHEPARPVLPQAGSPAHGGARAVQDAPAALEAAARSQSLEIGRLRTALGMVLAELESLRRQLPI